MGVFETILAESSRKPGGLSRVIERRAVKRDPKNRKTLLAMVALRKDGEIGAASSTPGFQVAIARGTNHELISIDPMFPRKKKD